MSSYNWPPQGSSGGIPVYSTLSAFPPASSFPDTLAIAADTGIVYESFGNAWVPIGGPSSVISVGTFDSGTASANGAHIDSNALIMQSATASVPGLVNIGAQTFAGNKTLTGTLAGTSASFSSTIMASNFTGSSSGTNTGDITLAAVGSTPSVNGASLSGQVLTLQPADGTNPGLVSIAAQTFAGIKTHAASLALLSTLTMAGSSSGVITVQTQAAAGTYNFNLPITAGISGQVLTSAGGIAAPMTWGSALTNPMTTLGDIIYENATPTPARLAGNTSATLSVLTQTGTGSVSAAPVWTTSTGTGNVVMSASPTLTGTITAAAATLSAQLTANFNTNTIGTTADPGSAKTVLTVQGSTTGYTNAVGLFVKAGTSSSDFSTIIANAGNTTNLFVLKGNGALTTRNNTLDDSTGAASFAGTLATSTIGASGAGNTAINTSKIIGLTHTGGTSNWGSYAITDGTTYNAYIGATGGSNTATTRLLGLSMNSATPQFTLDGNGLATFTGAMSAAAITMSGALNATANGAAWNFGGSNAAAYNTITINNNSSTGFTQFMMSVGSSGANGQAGVFYAPGTFFALGPVGNDTTSPIVLRNNNGTTQLTIAPSGTVTIANLAGTGTRTVRASSTGLLSAAASSVPTQQTLLSGTGSTYTTPTGCIYFKVYAAAGGGGGAATGTSPGGATAGGTTSFGSSLITCTGGSGGSGATGGAGGTVTATGLTAILAPGTNGNSGFASVSGSGGAGGCSVFGGAGQGGGNTGAGGAAMTNSGSGGGGAGGFASGSSGGGGGAGGYVMATIVNPSGTYTYTVGAAGAGGSAGTGGTAGGNGAAGRIYIEEYYS